MQGVIFWKIILNISKKNCYEQESKLWEVEAVLLPAPQGTLELHCAAHRHSLTC